MRLRKVKNANEIITGSKHVILEPVAFRGKWQEVFGNNNPIYIEIGTGKGKFILESATRNPDINFIGIEKYDSVIARAIEKLNLYEHNNLRLIRMDAIYIDGVFDKEIDRIYLNFSDPWPKDRHAKRRLTSSLFLSKYEDLFKRTREIFLKTDNKALFEYSLSSLVNAGYELSNISFDLKNEPFKDNVTTEYEDKFISNNQNIYRLEAYKK